VFQSGAIRQIIELNVRLFGNNGAASRWRAARRF